MVSKYLPLIPVPLSAPQWPPNSYCEGHSGSLDHRMQVFGIWFSIAPPSAVAICGTKLGTIQFTVPDTSCPNIYSFPAPSR